MAYTDRDSILKHLGASAAVAGDRVFDEATGAVAAVDQAIDNYTNRSFGKQAGAVREFAPTVVSRMLDVGDVLAVTRVEVREAPGGPWVPVPADGWDLGQPGRLWPAHELWRAAGAWPCLRRPLTSVRVTGTFGWAAVPADVSLAAMYWACSMVQEKAIPLADADGEIVASVSDAFSTQNLAKRLLGPYKRWSVSG